MGRTSFQFAATIRIRWPYALETQYAQYGISLKVKAPVCTHSLGGRGDLFSAHSDKNKRVLRLENLIDRKRPGKTSCPDAYFCTAIWPLFAPLFT